MDHSLQLMRWSDSQDSDDRDLRSSPAPPWPRFPILDTIEAQVAGVGMASFLLTNPSPSLLAQRNCGPPERKLLG